MGIITHLGSRFFALLFLSLLSVFVLVHTESSSLDAAVMLILRQNLNASKSLGSASESCRVELTSEPVDQQQQLLFQFLLRHDVSRKGLSRQQPLPPGSDTDQSPKRIKP
ncbi:hypothetical protein ACSBR2_039441 [Camellia fascicularis]